jgi:hypothetical protein
MNMASFNPPPKDDAAENRGKPDGCSTRREVSAFETALQVYIDRQLRAMFDELMQLPVPDRFARLLEELERKRKMMPPP